MPPVLVGQCAAAPDRPGSPAVSSRVGNGVGIAIDGHQGRPQDRAGSRGRPTPARRQQARVEFRRNDLDLATGQVTTWAKNKKGGRDTVDDLPRLL